MKISFPHMGNIYIPLSTLLRGLGCEVIIPPRPTSRSIQLGAKYSPEFVCLPYKANLGDLINALELGADALLFCGGSWACRFGYYGRLHHETLRDLGYKFESIILRKDGIADIFNRVKELQGGSTSRALYRAVSAIRFAWRKSVLVEKVESLARMVRPYEIEKGETTRVLNSALEIIHKANSLREIRRAQKQIKNNFQSIKIDRSRKPLKVKLVGETHILLEPAVNFDIERKLGEMGVYVDPALTVHRWLIHPFHLGTRGKRGEEEARKFAKPYHARCVGGEDQLSIGYTILAGIDKYDGVIHVLPFTCMAENVAREILPRVSRIYDIPVMSISIDEHTGVTGFTTRLEAFVDLLNERRRQNLSHSAR